jgi:hypothetical protein
VIRLLVALAQRIVRLVAESFRARRARRVSAVDGQNCDQTIDYTDSDPIVPTSDREQAEALDRVRRIYHRGTQPLTVAKARYDLIRRGILDADDR